jgi:RES domain
VPKRKPAPPPPRSAARPAHTPSILELERFSQENLTRWNAASKDLDELQAALYFGVQPEQRRLRLELLAALGLTQPLTLLFLRWTRVVTYQYSTEPLSTAGSLHAYGGRFNPGADLDPGTLDPWPALYIGEHAETALREKFQMATNDKSGGLTPEELALTGSSSYASVTMNGDLHRVFDLTTPVNLKAAAKVLGRIRLPSGARAIMKRLRIKDTDLRMVTTSQQLYDAVLTNNWRVRPVQFGLPAPSHTLAELIRASGFEAILYRSTKGQGRCLAVFPDQLTSKSFVELADAAPAAVKWPRLDIDSADDLAGWDSLPAQRRPRRGTARDSRP